MVKLFLTIIFIKTTIIDDLSLAEKKTRESYNLIRDKQLDNSKNRVPASLPEFDVYQSDEQSSIQADNQK